jgi:hypothetical protein
MWGQLLIETLSRPREAAKRVLGAAPDLPVLIEAAVAVTCLGLVMGFLVGQLSPGAMDPVTQSVLRNPLVGAVFQFAALLGIVALTAFAGRIFGGAGDFRGALALVVWLNAAMLVLQALQLGLMVVLPPLAPIVALAALLWAIWAFAGFVTELHGFQNQAVVLGGVLVGMVGLFVALSILMAMLGLTPTPGVG